MLFNKVMHIFRDYDIRGIFGKDLTPEIVARIGVAIATYNYSSYAVGGDIRSTTPILMRALESGLMSGGVNVFDIGIGPIGMGLYSTLHKGFGMAYITASHLPAEWNGIKLSKPNGELMFSRDIYSIRNIFLDESSLKRCSYKDIGRFFKYDLLEEYAEFLEKAGRSGGARIVVDCGNGAASLVAPQVMRNIGNSVIGINCDIDFRFPVRGAEPLKESLYMLSKTVLLANADFGVAYDGDGDRVLFIDDSGNILSSEQAAIVMLEGMGRGDIVANVECSMILEEYVREHKHKIYKVPVGRAYMVKKVAETNAIIGVERSGHFTVWRNLNMDDGILTSLYFAKAVSNLSQPIHKIVPKLYPLMRINIEASDKIKFKVIEKLKDKFMKEYSNIDTIDGIRINLDYGWILIRASNTEPVIRVTIEAENKRALEKIKKNFLKKIQKEIRSKGY